MVRKVLSSLGSRICGVRMLDVKRLLRQNGLIVAQSRGPISDRLDRCGQVLDHWNKTVFGKVETQITIKTKELKSLLTGGCSNENIVTINQCRTYLNEWQHKEEIIWKQRAKDFWITEGDKNSRYFHQTASCKRKNNNIISTLDSNGNVITEVSCIEGIFVDYFSNIFSSTGSIGMDAIFQSLRHFLTPSAKQLLDRPFSEEEVYLALKDMDLYKAAGPDGMNAKFFQDNWR